MSSSIHIPVLLEETITALAIKADQWYVDGTFGFGGHSREIIKRGGKVLGIDQDEESLKNAVKIFESEINKGKLVLEKSNFRSLAEIASKALVKPLGILLDLGFSSWQLDQSGRGFSFLKNEFLDMRMDPTNQAVKAKDLVNGLYEKELGKLIDSYGEDPLAFQIARYLIRKRKEKPIENTFDLANLIRDVYKHYYHGRSSTNPATKTFQALRIAVNDEINALKEGLEGAINILASGGVLAVITFHGLEDRTVKKTFQHWTDLDLGVLVSKKAIIPSEEELKQNPRSHSAKLRVFIKQ